MTNLEVSVAMATYNGAAYIGEQLRSLAEQTQLPAELVICDDGSRDETLQVAAAFAATAPFPVHIHRNEQRLGYRANFMRAASLCQSELIAFSDQDDIWEPNKIKACARRFQNAEVLLTYHNALVIDSEGREIGVLSNRAAPHATNPPLSLDPWTYGLGFTLVLRNDLLALNKLWSQSVDHCKVDEPMAHDQWFFFLAGALGKIAYIDEALVRYRQHGTNLYGWEGCVRPVPTLLSRIRGHLSLRSRLKRLVGLKTVRRMPPPYETAARRRAEILDAARAMLTGAPAELALAARNKYRSLAP